jgi:hypothetical protein
MEDLEENLEIRLKNRVKKYRQLTEEALEKVKLAIPRTGYLRELSEKFVDFCRQYLEDGKFYEEKGMLEIALASYAYAHAWLDAGSFMGFFDVSSDNRLFVLWNLDEQGKLGLLERRKKKK